MSSQKQNDWSKPKNSSKNGRKNKKVTSRSSLKICQERLACKGERPEAKFECTECKTYQCEVCEELLHENSRFVFHERHALESVPPEKICGSTRCQDKNYVDVYCRDCDLRLCFSCDQITHSQPGLSNKKHSKEITSSSSTSPAANSNSTDHDSELLNQHKSTSGEVKENEDGSSSGRNEVESPEEKKKNKSASRDQLDLDADFQSIKSNSSSSSGAKSSHNIRINNHNTPKNHHNSHNRPLPDIAQMSLDPDSIDHDFLTADFETEDDPSTAIIYPNGDEEDEDNRQEFKSRGSMSGGSRRSRGMSGVSGGDGSSETTHTSFLLLDELEKMQISTAEEFAHRLGCTPENMVKVVSIFGNTGEGKSHTLNYTFFGGREIFKTSPAQSSCTIGIWTAYDPKNRVITVDTEGLLGVSENNNRRTRLLLKVLAISDVIIYRTRAERLHNDLFSFLGDASRAYVHHFSSELKAASIRSGHGYSLSDLGPIVVVFHETLHTEILRQHEDRSPEDSLRRRFQSLNLSTEAYSAFEYVGTRTSNPPTSFRGLKSSVERHIQNSTVRSARSISVIFNALKFLNEKFSGDIEKSIPNTFPDEYFTCSVQCLSCGAKCINSMNHQRDGVGHRTGAKCRYQHQFENKAYHCRQCYDRGEEVLVTPRTSECNDSTWVGLAKYAWYGYVLECNRCGVIYRSRQYWYGNSEPWDCVRTEIQHIWPGEQNKCMGSNNAAQKVLDSIKSITETASGISARPTQQIKGWLADQIAPGYWMPNSMITHCGICEKEFADVDVKHHCRNCGKGFCEECSSQKHPVPEKLGWGLEPVRVCDTCFSKSDSSESSDSDMVLEPPGPPPTVRKGAEVIATNVGYVASVFEYPSAWIKESARPEYWVPDKDIKECHVCSTLFSEKLSIHHCRSCGNGVCDPCSQTKKPVPNRGWHDPARVCDSCLKTEQQPGL